MKKVLLILLILSMCGCFNKNAEIHIDDSIIEEENEKPIEEENEEQIEKQKPIIKKTFTCSQNLNGNNYTAIVTFKHEYENDSLVSSTLTVIKNYNNEVDASNDDMANTVKESIKNGTTEPGVSSNVEITGKKVTILATYDIKNYPSLDNMVADDTSYEVLKQSLIDQGYKCN